MDHCRVWRPPLVSLSSSVSGADMSEYRGMKVRKKFAIPKNERECLTVSGAGHFTMTATFDSVGAQLSADEGNPRIRPQIEKARFLNH